MCYGILKSVVSAGVAKILHPKCTIICFVVANFTIITKYYIRP